MSYSWGDKAIALRLAEDFRRAGARVWIDDDSIKVGESLLTRIADAIDEMDYVAALISPASIGSEWVRRELMYAMEKEICGKRVVVLPILVSPCDFPRFLRGKKYADLSTEGSYRSGLEQIRKAMGLSLRSARETPYRAWVQNVCHVMGFDRDEFVRHCLAHLVRARGEHSVIIKIRNHLRYEAANQLHKVGAFKEGEDTTSIFSGSRRFEITPDGIALCEFLEMERNLTSG